MLCIYHIADHDGKGSAAIVKYAHKECELLGYNYDQEIPYEEIDKHDKVVICDISFPMEYMFKLHAEKDVTWIDHHASAIAQYDAYLEKVGGLGIKGFREIGTAAIELTWKYFFPEQPVPEGVRLLALNDLFDLRDKRVRPFEFAFQSQGVNRPYDKVWKDLFEGKTDIDLMVEKGNAILSYIKHRDYRLVRNMAFEGTYNGLRCIAANMPQAGSDFFESLDNIKKYDFMVSFSLNKRNRWNLSFRSTTDDVDVSKIAAAFGGGGHRRAAGASGLVQLPEFLRENIREWTKFN
ncbi:MAG: DHHA1 domain-containing protein [Acetobacter sp.]|nr:DHHA1 domain-containing protein [Acetobacter sp.]